MDYVTADRDSLWKESVQRLVDRMAQLMVYKNDYCCYLKLLASQGATVSSQQKMLGPDYCAEADQLVTLTFPMAAPELEEAIAGVNYTLLIKGKDVLFIDPTGKHYPIYRGFRYRHYHVRWVKRERFVSTDPLQCR